MFFDTVLQYQKRYLKTKINNIMSRKLSESVKKIVAHRQRYICFICNELLPPCFQVDHIIPHSISSDDTENNLQALCPNCHSLKTQRENIRIQHYKKLLLNCPDDCKLCWFCVETYKSDESHNCDKTLKNIKQTVKKQKYIMSSFEEMCNKYKYTRKQDLEDDDDVLKIVINLNDLCIYIQNIIYKVSSSSPADLSPSDIVDAIILVCKKNKKQRIYSCVELSIESDLKYDEYDDDVESCLDYLQSTLPDLVPDNIVDMNTMWIAL